MSVLVDSSIWIDFFRDKKNVHPLEFLIEENLVVTNNLILAELIPPLYLKGYNNLISLLYEVTSQPMETDWDEIIQLQTLCLRNGINGVGIPDLMIAQNTIQGNLTLFSKDKHFKLISEHISLELYAEGL